MGILTSSIRIFIFFSCIHKFLCKHVMSFGSLKIMHALKLWANDWQVSLRVVGRAAQDWSLYACASS